MSENVVKSTLPSFELPKTPACQYLAQRIASHDPNMIALIDPIDNTQYSFGELHHQIQTVSSGLLAMGVAKSDLVLFFGDNSTHYAFLVLSTIYLGVTFSPVTPANGPFEVTQQLKDSKGTVLIIDQDRFPILEQILRNSEYCDALKQIKLLIVMNANEVKQEIANHFTASCTYDYVCAKGQGLTLAQIPYYPTTMEDHYMLVYTSGTTGLPKGAIHSQYSWLATLINMRESSDMIGWRASLTFPLGHMSGNLFLAKFLDSGMSVVLIQRHVLEQTLAIVDKCKINYLIFTPSNAVHLANTEYEYDLSSIKMFLHGGSKIPQLLFEKIKNRFKVPVIEIYGATEMVGTVLIKTYGPTDYPAGSVGRLMGNIEMKIVSLETGQSVGAMQPGEICFRGPPCFVGYLNNEKATRATIQEGGWYHSGDVGYYDHSGALFVIDRIKEIIKFRHWSIFPAEIEDFLHRNPAIEAVCVVGVKHVTDGELVRAYIQLKPTHTGITAQEIINSVKENLGFQKRLRGGVYFIDQFPRTSLGKVERKYFKNLVKSELITEPVE